LLLTVLMACVRVQSGYGLGPEDDGTTKTVRVGSEVRLVLPADLDWQLEGSNTKALVLKNTSVGSVGGSALRTWTFDVTAPGDLIIRATGAPACLKAVPPCSAPSVHYRFTLHVVT
jgi:predicted secreted protein